MQHSRLFMICGLSLVLGTAAQAAAPEVKTILPRGGQRGTDVAVKFVGNRLEDAKEAIIYEPGIEVVDLAVENGNTVKATFRIAPNCVPGTKHVRLRSQSGLSDEANFSVGALPSVAEVEPNSEFAKPQSIAFNSSVDGTITNEDVDYFIFEAKQGERITVEIEGIRLGDTMFDPYIAILNEARFELAACDDAAFAWQDGVASLIAPADGKYLVMIRDSSFGGNGESHYRCHIGNYPRPVATVPSGGKPGETVAVTFRGDVSGPFTMDVTLPDQPLGNALVLPTDSKGVAPTQNAFRVGNLDSVVETEPNDGIAQAPLVTLPVAMHGMIQTERDQDLFAFTAKKGEVWDFTVYARRLRSELDPVIQILNEKGGGVAGNDDSPGTPDSQLRFNCPNDGKYFVLIRDHLFRGGESFHYRIEAMQAHPVLDFTVNEYIQFKEDRLAIPQGGRLALLVTAQRKDVGGPIEFDAENLPSGVSLEKITLAGDQAVAQIVLKAEADAPLGTKFGQIVGRIADPNQPNLNVSARVRQDAVLIRGRNNIPFWVEPLPALAVTVTEKLPFSVEIVEPKVALVQGGAMQLKVVAHREGEFKAPIKIDLLQNPPGVNSSRSVSIAEGQNEALIDINAAGNAKVGEFPIVVRCSTTVGNGEVVTATPIAKLRVTDQYLTFAYQKTTVEQNQETEIVIKIDQKKPFEGTAKVTLIGLPNQVTTEPQEITAKTEEIIFKLKAGPEAAVGNHKNLFCQVIVPENGESMLHNLGSGELRVDKPLPPKVNAPPPTPMPAAPVAEAAPQPKRLSRLEQLREEQKAKAANP